MNGLAPLLLAAAAALPAPLEGVGLEERLGVRLPLDLVFRDAGDAPVRLGDLFTDGKPVVLTLAYYQCPMLCNLVLRGLADAARGADHRLGRDYRAVTLSFDPRDSWREAGRARDTLLAAAAAPAGSWTFLADPEHQSRRVAEALGFSYRWDDATGQFAHPAAVFVLTPDGRLARVLYGADFEPRQLDLALADAAAGQPRSLTDRVLMLCFHWDPASRRYGLFVARFLRLGAALVVLTLATLIVTMLVLEHRRRRPS